MNNEWIPVSERLPDKDGRYLVSKRIFKNDTTEVVSNFNSVENNFYTGYHDIITDDVVAWMPLPLPYVSPIREIKVTLTVPNYISDKRIINYLSCRLDDSDIIKSIKLEEDDECSDS